MGARSWFFTVALLPALACGLVEHDGEGDAEGGVSLGGAASADASSGGTSPGSADPGGADDAGWVEQFDDALGLSECVAGVSGAPDHVVTTWRESAYGGSTSVTAYTAEGWRLRSVSDYDSDGEADGEWRYTLDEWGNPTREERWSGDGVLEWVEVRTYEAGSDRILSRMTDKGADGVPDSLATWDYGTPSTMRSDDDADGDVDLVLVGYFGADEELLRLEFDQDGDGFFERVDEWSYDSEGRLLRESSEYHGELASVVTYSYVEDHEGRLLSTTITVDLGDPLWEDPPPTLVRYVYDDAGLLIRTETDEEQDDKVDDTVEYAYDSAGRLTWKKQVSRFNYSLCEYEYGRGAEPIGTRCNTDANEDWELIEVRTDCPP